MAFSSGHRLKDGDYVIEKEIGRGGFGITYLAKSKNGEQVVIKTLNDEVRRSPDFAKSQEEFVNEAVKLAKCDHPHVVQVEELLQEGALWCIVMEYLSGENLASFIMNRGVLPEADALLYISQIGAALELTHSKNLLHRDVKPANIMLRNCRGGKPCTPEAVLIDFGLARKFIPNQINSHTTLVTPGYAPIEQYYKQHIRGAYTDVYALAATLYVLLTKVLPEPALERAEEVSTRKSDPLVPPKRINSNISDQVNRAILQGMEIDPTRRPQSVGKWLGLLEVDHKNSFRNVDSQAPTIRIPGVSPFLEFFKQKAPKTPSPPPSIEKDDYLDWNKRGDALYNLKKYEEAIKSYDQALALKPDSHVIWSNRGGALYNLKKYEEAIKSYDQALALKPDDHVIWNSRGNALFSWQKYEEAIKSYDQALALKPDGHVIWDNRGDALFGLTKYEEAIKSYDKALALKPDYYDAWTKRGNALRNLNKYEEAIKSYDQALALKPDYYDAWTKRGEALYWLKKYEEAIACYDQALALNPDSYVIWDSRGGALYKLKKYEEAISCYDKALALDPDRAYGWNNQGQRLSNLKKYEEAIACYDKALALEPDNSYFWSYRGDALFNWQKYEEAIKSYDLAVVIQPYHYFAWHNRGRALYNLSKYEEAIKNYDQALAIKPDCDDHWSWKAKCHALQGQVDLAIESLRQAIKLNPNYRKKAKTDSDFDRIRKDPRFFQAEMIDGWV
jgi:tetratricopeptide (TPR) repeat protein/tRNA A-37 threonylcarbamoyl transferase component Bud32